jgi:hypothetical protein
MILAASKEAIGALKSTPFLFALVMINVIALALMAMTLYYVAGGIERRDVLIKSCLEQR